MPMKVEAAIVTQKRPEAAYNTDSVNVNGKVMPREVIKNGYKGSGVLSGSVYFALTSSDVEGFADASVAAFNDRAARFSRSREPMSVFGGFFEDCRGALLNMDRSADELVGAGFYASGRRAVIAHNGATKIYLQRLGVATPVTAEKVADTTADFSGAVFSDVCEGDIFVLLSPGAAEALGEKEIEDILRISDGSVKRVVNYILKAALAVEGDKAVSAIVIKVLETDLQEELVAPVVVPDFSEKEEAAEPSAASDEAEENAEEAAETDESSEEAAVAENADVEAEEVSTDDITNIFAKNALEMFESADVTGDIAEKNDAVLYTEELGAAGDEPEVEEPSDNDALENKDDKKSRTPLFVILGIMLAVSLALIVALFVVPAFSDGGEETTIDETTTEEESTDEESTAEESTSEEETEEESSEENTTAAEATTSSASQETTTRAPVTENTTLAPVIVPEQTTAPEEETEASTEAEGTTAAEDTTAAVEDTTAAQEEVTEATDAATSEAVTEAPLTEPPAEPSEENAVVQ